MRRVFRLPDLKGSVARDVDAELAFHLETRVERLVAAGWSPDAARREALRQFGDVAAVRASMLQLDHERARATRRADVLSDLIQDAVYALRTLRRNLGVTVVIVAMLALGIGANTSIFTLIDAVLVRRLPVERPGELVSIGDQSFVNSFGQGSPRTDALSVPLYHDVRDENRVFTGLAATGGVGRVDASIERAGGNAGEIEHPRGRYVSANFFAVLGVPAARGRTLAARLDDVPGASPVVTISDAYWMRRFQRDPATIGRTLSIDGVRMTIVGVTPPSFTGEVVGESTDLWLPLAMHDVLEPNKKVLDDRSASWLLLLGRLRPGATLTDAQAQIESLIQAGILRNSDPRAAKGFLARKTRYLIASGARGLSEVRVSFEGPLFTLLAGVALLLCIICANVANLLLARAIARGREMAVRLALGADRLRIVRQLMTESALLALLGTGFGLLVAWWGSHALLALAADGGHIPLDLGLDRPVLFFALGVSVVAVALFGLAPALRASRVDLAQAMRARGGSSGARAPLGTVSIAGQVALSVVLLIGASMVARSLRNVESADTGMDREHLVIVDVDITARGGYQDARLETLTRAIRARLASLPGVAAVTFSKNGIFSGSEWHMDVGVPGFTAREPEDSSVATDMVGPNYASAIGARIVAGRDIAPSDEDRPPRVAVVNQALASFYFPRGNAVGRFLRFDDTVPVQIIGVMTDTRDHALAAPAARRVYFPFLHRGDTATIGAPAELRFAVRTIGPPAAMVQQLRKAVSSVDAQLPIASSAPLVTLMRGTIREERLVARVAVGFGALALLLAAIGLYGVMTYAITRRTGEIGLRVALGAGRGDVMRMVLRDALGLVAIGVAVGVPLALASARLLRAQLYDVSAVDPLSIGVAVGVLAMSAGIAASLPALRAARVSPMVALRE